MCRNEIIREHRFWRTRGVLRKARDDFVCLIVEGRHHSPELEAVTLAENLLCAIRVQKEKLLTSLTDSTVSDPRPNIALDTATPPPLLELLVLT